MNKIILDKLFPKYNGVDLKKLSIDETTMTYISTPYNAKLIAKKIRDHLPQTYNACICDATACVGGDTIAFSNVFDNVVSIEINKNWYEYLINNIKQYNLNNVRTICGDFCSTVPKLSGIDAVYIDPPWGGKDYKSRTNLRIFIGINDLEIVICNLFDTPNIKLVATKLPKNYDLKYFYHTIKKIITCKIYLNQMQKMNLLIIKYDSSEKLL